MDLALASSSARLTQAAEDLAERDDLDVSAVARAAQSGPVERRLQALNALASEFPKAVVLPMLQRFQETDDVVLKARAFELAMRRSDNGFEDILARAAIGGPGMQRSILRGALGQGPRGFRAMTAIAEAPALLGMVRALAVRAMAVRFTPGRCSPVIRRLLLAPDFEVAHAALLAAVQLGVHGFGLLKWAQVQSPIPAIRESALIQLAQHAPDPMLGPALGRGLQDPDRQVQCAAVEIGMRRAGADFGRFLERIVRTGRADLQQAGLDGAIEQGEAGFQAVTAFALELGLHSEVRRRALDALRRRFAPEDVAPVLARLPKETRDRSQPPEAPDTEPAQPAVANTPDVPDTEPAQPAVANPPDVPDTEPAQPAAPGPPAYQQELTRFDLPNFTRKVRPAPGDRAPTRPTPKAGAPPSGDPTGLSARQAGLPGGTPLGAPDASGSRSRLRAPSIRRRRPQIDLGRAQKALKAAVLAGPEGFRAIHRLAESPRVPDEVRVQAIRRLAADFPHREGVREVLELALSDEAAEVQNAGLGCAMLRDDTRFSPIEQLILNEASPGFLRIRAVRFLSARFEKGRCTPVLEALFEQTEMALRRVALECLFPSLKYVPPDRVESHLCNLLTEHHNAEVKVAAAKALGVFGGRTALPALDRFTGLFTEGEVKDAAETASARIRERLQ